MGLDVLTRICRRWFRFQLWMHILFAYADYVLSVTCPYACSVQLIDDGDKIQMHSLQGFLPTKIASFVMNVHTIPR